MTEFQVTVCSGITGDRIESVQAQAFPHGKLLSASGEATVSIHLDGKMSPTQIDSLFEEWKHIIVLERDGEVKYGGYITSEPLYTDDSSILQLKLVDVWGLLERRFAVDHSEPHVEKWSQTVTGNRATHLNQILIWARDSYTGTPAAYFPITIPGVSGGEIVTRTYYGYHLNYVDEAIGKLLDEGLDVYFEPTWVAPGRFGWITHAGDAWTSGVTREFSVTAPQSQVVRFEQRRDGSRVTNNASRVGEGSEVDMLTISNLDMSSELPLLERVTVSKEVTSASQLSIMAGEDLVTYRSATVQWDLEILSTAGVNIGDTLLLHFFGHRRVADGWHSRRVVKVQAGMGNIDTISVQPTGGA
ncbi:hypothetical protein [Microbacterium sp. K41]|uniref:hypothetical protein n=1 Tax=Microbacterium sp. K41 TaxID=2305437 RepID=UPI00109CFE5E|nr:hypothetical protein [Microbacterium sp. K41]